MPSDCLLNGKCLGCPSERNCHEKYGRAFGQNVKIKPWKDAVAEAVETYKAEVAKSSRFVRVK